MEANTKRLRNNIIVSLVAQGISLAATFVLYLIVPRFISEIEYSNWQSYMLYVGYVGILHFGILDGLVLRYAQYDYAELNKQNVRSQYFIVLAINVLFSLVGLITALLFLDGVVKRVAIFVSVGIITKNTFTYVSYLFQITNRIRKYAILVIMQKVALTILVTILLICKVQTFELFCIADLIADLIAIIYGLFSNKDLFWGKALPFEDGKKEVWESIKAGFLLMLANWSAMLFISGAKMIIQWHWDELLFGKISFSFSVSNIYLVFITAVSVVLFPSLKRMPEEDLPATYIKIRRLLVPILFGSLILYYPGCLILERWLPKYVESLSYIGMVLPIIVFSSINGLLTSNYLKAYRKETWLLWINLISVAVILLLYLLSAYVFNNYYLILVFVVIGYAARSIVSEIIIMKLIKKKLNVEFIVEVLMTAAFICCTTLMPFYVGMGVYAGALVVYLLINYIYAKYLKKKEEIIYERDSISRG